MSEVSEVSDSGQAAGDDSPGRTVAVAVGLGILGPVLALVSAVGVGLLDAALGLPLSATLALGLIFGQYVAFAGLALAYLRYRGFDWDGVRAYLGIEVPSLGELGLVAAGWVTIFGLILVSSYVVQLLGLQPAQNQTSEVAMQNPGIILPLIAAMFLVVGPCEEILYRGVVQGRLRESLSAVPSILIASTVFAAIHVMALTGGAGARLTTIALLFIPSLVLGALYEYTGNLVAAALLHAIHNSVLLVLLYLVVRFADELPTDPASAAALVPL